MPEVPSQSTIKYPSQGLQEGRVLARETQTTARDLSPDLKAQGSDPLVHRGELQHMAAELGSYKQAHTSSPPLTLGNSRVVEGPAPLKELGSRAQAMRGEFWFQGLGRRGPPPRLLPKPHCTGPSWTFLRVVSLLEGGPMSPFRAEPGRVPWAKTRPPEHRCQTQGPGPNPARHVISCGPRESRILLLSNGQIFIKCWSTEEEAKEKLSDGPNPADSQ
ncbi:hypothetical protein L3Q82_016371 [Scortum barcoo]|uniref:Uncharacterized protein n=1 Tax=Scortum barcoo TaxID=214431 RepID=A0ACB8X753_9TELE|nr:hypothetical protein L3Q82_016371 [Scortum barcoo]